MLYLVRPLNQYGGSGYETVATNPAERNQVTCRALVEPVEPVAGAPQRNLWRKKWEETTLALAEVG